MLNQKSKAYLIWMAWRHIVSRKGKSLSFMTVVSILGVTIGVAALVIVLSVMGGFEQDLKLKMFRGLPHMEILHENAIAGFSLKEVTLSKLAEIFPDAVGLEAFTKADVVLKRRKHLASVSLFGVDPKKGGRLWGFSDGMIQGEIEQLAKPENGGEGDSLPRIVLGETLAIQLGADVGDEVDILNPQSNISDALGGQTLSSRFKVIGIFMTDLPHYDSRYAVVSLESGRKFMPDYDPSLDAEEYVTGVAINMQRPEQVDVFVDRIGNFKNLKSVTWKNVNKSLLVALKLEKFTMGAILLLIVLVAAFSISGTMMITVYHKRSQVALMRSLGMEQKDIAKLFINQGCAIGSIGVFLGLCIGVGACLLIYYFQFIELPNGVYYQKKLPVRFLPLEYIIISICAWVLSLLAAVYPAAVAAKQDPGAGLRCL